jgi:hypothetical protein
VAIIEVCSLKVEGKRMTVVFYSKFKQQVYAHDTKHKYISLAGYARKEKPSMWVASHPRFNGSNTAACPGYLTIVTVGNGGSLLFH